ncbi:hypothetical protein E2C01_094999 [Portunus trituberculatus]|uniref:Uncharacterized protein n=1 Tax=Portunus trituberculatus TaxID=210409 RepID=A0A5B7JZ30_PORTR|nr:hypothetical protein [Portunus trituberculatus]
MPTMSNQCFSPSVACQGAEAGGGDASLPGMMNPRLTHATRKIGALEQARLGWRASGICKTRA